MAQPRIGLLAVSLGSFDQAVDLGTGRRTSGRIAEQPCLAAYYKRLYCSFGDVVVDG